MTYDQWKCRDPNDTGFYDMPEDDGPTELDIAYQRIEALEKAAITLAREVKGSFELFEPIARREIGNTNYRCIVDAADAVLAVVGGPSK